MILHDLRCTECDRVYYDVPCVPGAYGTCDCGSRLTWIPFVAATDVRGSEQTSRVLCEPDDPTRPLRWTSSRERDSKMRKNGFEPAGDRQHGSLGNSDPAKGRIYSRPSDKGSVAGHKR